MDDIQFWNSSTSYLSYVPFWRWIGIYPDDDETIKGSNCIETEHIILNEFFLSKPRKSTWNPKDEWVNWIQHFCWSHTTLGIWTNLREHVFKWQMNYSFLGTCDRVIHSHDPLGAIQLMQITGSIQTEMSSRIGFWDVSFQLSRFCRPLAHMRCSTTSHPLNSTIWASLSSAITWSWTKFIWNSWNTDASTHVIF